jgi:hypothetical protein
MTYPECYAVSDDSQESLFSGLPAGWGEVGAVVDAMNFDDMHAACWVPRQPPHRLLRDHSGGDGKRTGETSLYVTDAEGK